MGNVFNVHAFRNFTLVRLLMLQMQL